MWTDREYKFPIKLTEALLKGIVHYGKKGLSKSNIFLVTENIQGGY